MKKLVASIFGI